MDRSTAAVAPMSSAGRRGLYVETEPFAQGWMAAGGHEIYLSLIHI